MVKRSPVMARAAELWHALRGYLGAGGRNRSTRIADEDGLRRFLETRASHVTQISLYGYLRTRAGVRYPELFANDDFVRSIDIAKWYIWLACLSDLAVYAGGLVAHRTGATPAQVGALMIRVIDSVIGQHTEEPGLAIPQSFQQRHESRKHSAPCRYIHSLFHGCHHRLAS